MKKNSQGLRSRPPFTGVLRGPGLKVPLGVLFGQFRALASECPKECFLSALWRSLGLKMPKSTHKALFGALPKKHSVGHFQAGPRSTPVNGGQDRNPRGLSEKLPGMLEKANAHGKTKVSAAN